MAAKPALIRVELGNIAPHQTEQGLYTVHPDGSQHHHYGDEQGSGRQGPPAVARGLNPLLSHTTVVDLPVEHDPDRAAVEVLNLWPHHSSEAPSFVMCDDEDARRAVMEAFGLSDPSGPTALFLNSGRDWLSQQMFGAAVAAATNQGKYIALTANTASPAGADTSLTGEITTASGGLVRAAGTVAHTIGASTTTVSNTFTANGSDTLPVTVAKAWLAKGLTPTSGDGVFETLFSTTATLSASGDNIALVWTLTHA